MVHAASCDLANSRGTDLSSKQRAKVSSFEEASVAAPA
jgi:hypothetical protein